jgi:Uma2 family endonuclease
MVKTACRPLTVADYRELPEGPPYFQLIEGDLFMSPSPNLFHQRILRRIFFALAKYLEAHPTGEAIFAPSDVFLSDLNAYQPDLYFVSNARKSIFTEQGVEGAPDLVVEILSPKTARLDKGVKRQVYARTGVEELWIVDPESKTVEVYRFAESVDEPAGTYAGRQKFASPLFPGLQISVARIFQQ